MKYSSLLLLLAVAVVGCDKPTQMSTDSENSAINQRDQNDDAKTPLDQNENEKDIGITSNIRRQVVDSKMSVNAQNVKIISQDGNVTLRGPVATSDEKIQIDAIARKVAGESNVVNQLDVSKVK